MSHSVNGFPPELVGESVRARDCLAQFEQAAGEERGVLVVAEHGLDGESVARSLHAHSTRRAAPLSVRVLSDGIDRESTHPPRR